jgi:hypothetical protein
MLTSKYFSDQIRKLAARLTNVEARVPAGKIKVKFNPTNTITAGAYALVQVTVPGAVLGDGVVVTYPSDDGDPIVANATMGGSAGEVNVWVQNIHAADSKTLSGDWYVHVIK